MILFSFSEFRIKLKKIKKSQFDEEFIQIDEKNLKTADYLDKLYEGFIVDEPFNSSVSGTFINGLFYGTIKSLKHGTYFVESSKPYADSNSKPGVILYNEINVNSNQSSHHLIERHNLLDNLEFLPKVSIIIFIIL